MTAASRSTLGQATMRGRLARDGLFRRVMTVGGLSVIVAISLIFFYLGSVVQPMFMPAQVERTVRYPAPDGLPEATVHLSVEEQREVAARFLADGKVVFFGFDDGMPRAEARVSLPPESRPTAFAAGYPDSYAFAWGLSDGRAVVGKQTFRVTFPGDRRTITPRIEYPIGEAPVAVDQRGAPIEQLAVQHAEQETTLVARTGDGRLLLVGLAATKNLFTGEVSVERSGATLEPVEGRVTHLMLEVRQRDLYVAHAGRFVSHYDVTDKSRPRLVQRVQVVPDGERMTALTILSGGFSLIVGTDRGSLSQWFLVRDDENRHWLRRIRGFDPMPGPVTTLAPEYYRKGFVAADERGSVGIYYATSQRQVLLRSFGAQPLTAAAFAPRANGLLLRERDGGLVAASVHNEYPEISWGSLWGKVWYEGYQQPEYLWQSTAAVSDFEPKLSLAPLTFGTLKAAFYAMMVSVPLAVLGAIFTAYFMSAAMRRLVKPSIEIMEALPTVILGFLAGLWLAPIVDNNLPGVLLTILLLPVGMVAASLAWTSLPRSLTGRIAPGWEAALLVPVVIATIWAAFAIGQPVETVFFAGDMPNWLSNELGITYEQRNSLVVGIAMGFAVTPTIFSIAEDAIFSVPKHLTTGSLALGATPWQTLLNVVLLTASPGIFSAVMIGLGRAVGETMIVLMATGNTAVMDLSIFTGFRTLSANIGVEMPEAAVGTTHYRLLFLSALVLFAFTFCANTVAELVRHRLRERYSAI